MLSVQRRAQMTLAEVLAAATQRRLIIFGNQKLSARAYGQRTRGQHHNVIPTTTHSHTHGTVALSGAPDPSHRHTSQLPRAKRTRATQPARSAVGRAERPVFTSCIQGAHVVVRPSEWTSGLTCRMKNLTENSGSHGARSRISLTAP